MSTYCPPPPWLGKNTNDARTNADAEKEEKRRKREANRKWKVNIFKNLEPCDVREPPISSPNEHGRRFPTLPCALLLDNTVSGV